MKLSGRLQILCLIFVAGGWVLSAQVVDVGGHPQADYLKQLLKDNGGMEGLDRYLNSLPALKTSLVGMTGSRGNSQGTDWQLIEFQVDTMPGTRGDSLTVAFRGIRGSATLYEHFGFSGKQADIEMHQREANMKQSRFENIRILNEAVSSARVAGAGALKVYVRPNFAGKSDTLLTDNRAFDRGINDKISSFSLEPRTLRKKFSPLDEVVGLFVQYGPKVRITSPAAGTVWKRGETHTVRWTSQRASGNVAISVAEQGPPLRVIIPLVNRAANVAAGTADLIIHGDAKEGAYVLTLTLGGGITDSVRIRIGK